MEDSRASISMLFQLYWDLVFDAIPTYLVLDQDLFLDLSNHEDRPHGISGSRIFHDHSPEDESSPLLCTAVKMTRFDGQQVLLNRNVQIGG